MDVATKMWAGRREFSCGSLHAATQDDKRPLAVEPMTMKILLASAIMLGSAQPEMAPPTAGSTAVIPFTIEESAGSPRVIVSARFNGHALPMMVHSNADFFAQLKHDQAKAFGVQILPGPRTHYGIDRAGHVSGLGLHRGIARTLAIGRSVSRNAPISVFEIPQDRLGMLGVGWIRSNRVIVDFGRKQILISPTAARVSMLVTRMRRQGYVALPLRYDEQARRYLVEATINGVTRSMAIATASGLLIDSEFASAASLRLGADDGRGSGPTGSHVPSYAIAKPVRFTIGGWTSPSISTGRIVDEYKYLNEERPSDPARARGGDLGGAFLRETAAVIDFGSCTLFVKG